MKKIILVTMLLISFFQLSCAADNPVKTTNNKSKPPNVIIGQVLFSGTGDIPAGASIIVTLDDVSLADASAITLGKYETKGPTSFPVPFTIQYDPAKIGDKGPISYSVSARIEYQGKLLYINDMHIPAFNDYEKSDPHNIKVPVIKVR